MKKRTKKKVSFVDRIAQSKQSKQLVEWKKVDVLYEFNMEFAIEKVNKIVGDYADAHGLSDDDYVPSHVTVGAYECQDLIIAMKKQMIKTPEFWEVGID